MQELQALQSFSLHVGINLSYRSERRFERGMCDAPVAKWALKKAKTDVGTVPTTLELASDASLVKDMSARELHRWCRAQTLCPAHVAISVLILPHSRSGNAC